MKDGGRLLNFLLKKSGELKRFIEDREIELRAPLVPNAKTGALLDEALRDIRKGRENKFSPAFDSAEDAIKWLKA